MRSSKERHRALLALGLATIVSLLGASGIGAARGRSTAAFPVLRHPALEILAVTNELQAGDAGEVAIRVGRPSRCTLTLRGPRRAHSGPYAARVHVYARWLWRVPRTVRGGAWTATVRCRRGARVHVRRAHMLVGVTRANRTGLVAHRSLRLSRRGVSLTVLEGGPSRKGGGSYPNDDAACKWTGSKKGRCRGGDWGYLNPKTGTWSLLSSRGFNYRNCTDFVAWFMSLSWDDFGFAPGQGNAADWRDHAANAGLVVESAPAVGDIAWWGAEKADGAGHVGIVTALDANGTVSISEYNGDGHGIWDLRPNLRADAYLRRPPLPPPVIFVPPPTTTTPTTTTPPQTTSSTTTTTQVPPQQPPPPPTWDEQQGHLGVNTFTNPYNASGMGPRIGAGAVVAVSCKLYAPQIQSVNPDGYWYRIHSGPWNDAYYSPANTFMNGDPWNGPYTHNTDYNVRDC
jgi:surface antigen